jgi:hypothetical protein
MKCSPPSRVVAQGCLPIFREVGLNFRVHSSSINRGKRCMLHQNGSVLAGCFDKECVRLLLLCHLYRLSHCCPHPIYFLLLQNCLDQTRAGNLSLATLCLEMSSVLVGYLYERERKVMIANCVNSNKPIGKRGGSLGSLEQQPKVRLLRESTHADTHCTRFALFDPKTGMNSLLRLHGVLWAMTTSAHLR